MLPEDTYADLLVRTGHGNLYTDMPIEFQNTDNGNEISLNPLAARENGGGGNKASEKKPIVANSDSNGAKILEALSKQAEMQGKETKYSSVSFRPFMDLSIIKGKLNGGGGSIILESRNNNVYVRSH